LRSGLLTGNGATHTTRAWTPATATHERGRHSGRSSGLPSSAAQAVALLLPLSGRQHALGIAVRDGFLAGCLVDPASAPRVRIYDTAALGAGPAYQQALADRAEFVVGPLTREDVQALVTTQSFPVPTLALNAYPDAAPPPFLFQFPLDPEQEARAVARRIAADGHVRGIALFPRNAWEIGCTTPFRPSCRRPASR